MDRETLKQKKLELAQSERPPRAREAAKTLGISEAEYVALDCGEGVQALNMTRITEILLGVPLIGEVMALTRNDAAVMEHHGKYTGAAMRKGLLVFSSPDSLIDLRLRINAWQFGFAVDENGRHSLQFFDQYGRAAHKIYMTEYSDFEAYLGLIAEFEAPDCFDEIKRLKMPAETATPLPEVDVQALRKDWRSIEDSHHVNALLKAYGLTRPQVYERLGDDAKQLDKDGLKTLLETASEQQWRLNMFAPNGVATQIHSGPVSKIVEMGPWLNVLDPKFNLHLNATLVTQVWSVSKYLDGRVNSRSVQLFDANQQSVMMVYFAPEMANTLQEASWNAFLDKWEAESCK
ncbi:ChuX/HutX family heme-like substrate-binding protein [Hydrogenovibrio sp. JE_KL2]|uniref:ChuX/HutX family heme-like substrate-binding protein n=1 Tax=Hydrogenovibrio sp. JE_KL2 TaxID=2651188 RepID=UPI00128C2765|nr:ChuX/HutX family heme-like substrate-binding protein [Hydrogenovibrio sp. JE_KL2]MPQ77318.1 hemin-degrading factor [Hydrogenovibrio sp. JE_KL2]